MKKKDWRRADPGGQSEGAYAIRTVPGGFTPLIQIMKVKKR